MIRNNTARTLMYSWHDGMASSFSAAASSGFVTRSLTFTIGQSCANGSSTSKVRQKQIVHNNMGFYVLPWARRCCTMGDYF